jgi:hypothetical protein
MMDDDEDTLAMQQDQQATVREVLLRQAWLCCLPARKICQRTASAQEVARMLRTERQRLRATGFALWEAR